MILGEGIANTIRANTENLYQASTPPESFYYFPQFAFFFPMFDHVICPALSYYIYYPTRIDP